MDFGLKGNTSTKHMDAYDRFMYEILKLKVEEHENLEFVRALSSVMQMTFQKKKSNPARFRDYLQQMMNEYDRSYKA